MYRYLRNLLCNLTTWRHCPACEGNQTTEQHSKIQREIMSIFQNATPKHLACAAIKQAPDDISLYRSGISKKKHKKRTKTNTSIKSQKYFPQKTHPEYLASAKIGCRANKRVVIFLCVRDKWCVRRCQSGRVGPYNNRCHNARCNLLSACSLGYI